MPDIENATDPFLEGLIEDAARARVTAHNLRQDAKAIDATATDLVQKHSHKVAAAMRMLAEGMREQADGSDRYADRKHAEAVKRGKAQGAE